MNIPTRISIALLFSIPIVVASCGDNPVRPQEMVTVTWPTGTTLFIGNTAQLQARSGANDITNNAAWSSDNTNVATVDSNGLVTARGPGEASIIAQSGEQQGVLKLRVFPNFDGTWRGIEVITSCTATGTFEGFCSIPEFSVGDQFAHSSTFRQNQAAVDATIDTGDGTSVSTTGTISVGGELALESGFIMPEEPLITAELRNWKTRANVPGRMTGFLRGPLHLARGRGFSHRRRDAAERREVGRGLESLVRVHTARDEKPDVALARRPALAAIETHLPTRPVTRRERAPRVARDGKLLPFTLRWRATGSFRSSLRWSR